MGRVMQRWVPVLAGLALWSVSCERSPVVVLAPADEPALLAAKEEAHRRWEEFTAALASREPDAAYAVKAAFPVRNSAGTVETHEHMWLQVTSVEGTRITGTLDNEPTQRGTGLRLGDVVTIELEQMEDWLIGRGPDNITGGFSIPALTQRDAERR